MKHQKNFYVILCLIVILMISLGVALSCSHHKAVRLVKEESYFSDFKVKGEEVYIRCFLTLSNSSQSDVQVRLAADMSEDVKGGLLAEPVLSGYDKNKRDMFLVPAQSQKEYKVTFIGEFAGRKVKQNRNLPDIRIIEIGSGDSSEYKSDH